MKTNRNGGRRSTFAGNSALLPSDVIDFAMLPAQNLLAGKNFIVRYHHMTLKKPMRPHAVGEEIPAI